MARKYDSRTTIFSPEGRLYQVEYALEAINRAGTCFGIVCEDGIILASEKRNFHELLESTHEKIFPISSHMCCCVAGVTSDANVVIDIMRKTAVESFKTFQEPIPIEQMVVLISDFKQKYTQIGGYRPFGASILYAGWDQIYGFQLFQSDPSGNYSGWNSTCIGRNNSKAFVKLKELYKPGLNIEEGLELTLKIVQECVETNVITFKNLECAVFKKENNSFTLRYLTGEEIEKIPGNKLPEST